MSFNNDKDISGSGAVKFAETDIPGAAPANVLNFHMQSPFWLILLLYRRRNASSNVQSPPVLRKAKPGGHAQSIISLMKIRNPNPFPIGNKFGFFMYGGA